MPWERTGRTRRRTRNRNTGRRDTADHNQRPQTQTTSEPTGTPSEGTRAGKEGGARTGGGKTRATPRGGARTEGGAGAHGGHGEETWAAIAVLNDEGSSTTEKVVDATTGDTVTVKATYTTHQGDK